MRSSRSNVSPMGNSNAASSSSSSTSSLTPTGRQGQSSIQTPPTPATIMANSNTNSDASFIPYWFGVNKCLPGATNVQIKKVPDLSATSTTSTSSATSHYIGLGKITSLMRTIPLTKHSTTSITDILRTENGTTSTRAKITLHYTEPARSDGRWIVDEVLKNYQSVLLQRLYTTGIALESSLVSPDIDNVVHGMNNLRISSSTSTNVESVLGIDALITLIKDTVTKSSSSSLKSFNEHYVPDGHMRNVTSNDLEQGTTIRIGPTKTNTITNGGLEINDEVCVLLRHYPAKMDSSSNMSAKYNPKTPTKNEKKNINRPEGWEVISIVLLYRPNIESSDSIASHLQSFGVPKIMNRSGNGRKNNSSTLSSYDTENLWKIETLESLNFSYARVGTILQYLVYGSFESRTKQLFFFRQFIDWLIRLTWDQNDMVGLESNEYRHSSVNDLPKLVSTNGKHLLLLIMKYSSVWKNLFFTIVKKLSDLVPSISSSSPSNSRSVVASSSSSSSISLVLTLDFFRKIYILILVTLREADNSLIYCLQPLLRSFVHGSFQKLFKLTPIATVVSLRNELSNFQRNIMYLISVRLQHPASIDSLLGIDTVIINSLKESQSHRYSLDRFENPSYNTPWINVPLIPTLGDIANPDMFIDNENLPGLRQNAYPTTDKYLETLFRLQRADALQGIIDAIHKLSQGEPVDPRDINMYDNIRVCGYSLMRSGDGIHTAITYKPRNKSTKKKDGLMTGNLLCISLDGTFTPHSLVWGLVAPTSEGLEKLNAIIIELIPIVPKNAEKTGISTLLRLIEACKTVTNKDSINTSGSKFRKDVVMIESPVYFESVRYALEKLQNFGRGAVVRQRVLQYAEQRGVIPFLQELRSVLTIKSNTKNRKELGNNPFDDVDDNDSDLENDGNIDSDEDNDDYYDGNDSENEGLQRTRKRTTEMRGKTFTDHKERILQKIHQFGLLIPTTPSNVSSQLSRAIIKDAINIPSLPFEAELVHLGALTNNEATHAVQTEYGQGATIAVLRDIFAYTPPNPGNSGGSPIPAFLENWNSETKRLELLKQTDLSQRKALTKSFEKRVNVIQGPPGTGKTTTSANFVSILRDYHGNKLNNGPILMLSVKNHALDQFLIRFYNQPGYKDKIARVGGRSEAPELAKVNLSELRRQYKEEFQRNRDFRKKNEKKKGSGLTPLEQAEQHVRTANYELGKVSQKLQNLLKENMSMRKAVSFETFLLYASKTQLTELVRTADVQLFREVVRAMEEQWLPETVTPKNTKKDEKKLKKGKQGKFTEDNDDNIADIAPITKANSKPIEIEIDNEFDARLRELFMHHISNAVDAAECSVVLVHAGKGTAHQQSTTGTNISVNDNNHSISEIPVRSPRNWRILESKLSEQIDLRSLDPNKNINSSSSAFSNNDGWTTVSNGRKRTVETTPLQLLAKLLETWANEVRYHSDNLQNRFSNIASSSKTNEMENRTDDIFRISHGFSAYGDTQSSKHRIDSNVYGNNLNDNNDYDMNDADNASVDDEDVKVIKDNRLVEDSTAIDFDIDSEDDEDDDDEDDDDEIEDDDENHINSFPSPKSKRPQSKHNKQRYDPKDGISLKSTPLDIELDNLRMENIRYSIDRANNSENKHTRVFRSLQYLALPFSPTTSMDLINSKDRIDDLVTKTVLWRFDYIQRAILIHELAEKRIKADEKEQNSIAKDYTAAKRNAEQARSAFDAAILSSMYIVGMTITGAAKYSRILERLDITVVVVEEAAEVSEPLLVAALPSSARHLYLSGDHKQLSPEPEYYPFTKEPFNLSKSLFERLFENNFKNGVLNTQNRMHSDLAELVRRTEIYQTYQDGQLGGLTVSTRRSQSPHVVDHMAHRVFWWLHSVDENSSSNGTNTRSRVNEEEAQRAVALTHYHLRNNVHPSRIAIIAAYRGQVHRIRELLRQPENVLASSIKQARWYGIAEGSSQSFSNTSANATSNAGNQSNNVSLPNPMEEKTLPRVCTIDEFQGDESDHIILSLVRNNYNQNQKRPRVFGFTSNPARILVSLSRARCSLVILGADSHFRYVKLWSKIIDYLQKLPIPRLGPAFSIICPKHPQETDTPKTVSAMELQKLLQRNQHFCKALCCTIVQCPYKHTCPRTCHLDAMEHSPRDCRIKVKISCNHCVGNYFEECRKVSKASCPLPCNRLLPCQHPCTRKCGELCLPEDECLVCETDREAKRQQKLQEVEQLIVIAKESQDSVRKALEAKKEHEKQKFLKEETQRYPQKENESSKDYKKRLTKALKKWEKQYMNTPYLRSLPCPWLPGHTSSVSNVARTTTTTSSSPSSSSIEEEEARTVHRRIMSSIQPEHGVTLMITKIEKVFAPALEQIFCESSTTMYFPDREIETLYHGTRKENIEKILKEGFKVQRERTSSTASHTVNMAGAAVYLCPDSSKACREEYTGANKDQEGQFFVCDVYLGNREGIKTIFKPDPTLDDPERRKKEKYDTCMIPQKSIVRFTEYAVYNTGCVLPKYVVTFKPVTVGMVLSPKSIEKRKPFKVESGCQWYRIEDDEVGGIDDMLTDNSNDQLSQHYLKIYRWFQQNSSITSTNNARMVALEVCINPILREKFENAKKLLTNRGITFEEKIVYHGTPTDDAIRSIQQNGFRIGGMNGHSVSNGQAHGFGIYSGLEARTSVGYSGSTKKLLICLSVIGAKSPRPLTSEDCQDPLRTGQYQVHEAENFARIFASPDLLIPQWCIEWK